jgi:hypothetical protein
MKTSLAQMSLVGLLNETYTTKIYLNPNIFSNVSTKGIDFTSYSNT